ncbi:MAG: hypothetical protein KA118_03435 [Verrucomicrobia bacterium]|nr:hypothetical protein [Verrucomicrobiota bacterium]
MQNSFRRWLALGLLAAWALGIAAPVGAQDAPASPPAAAARAKVKSMPFTGKVHAVDKELKTVTLTGRTKNRLFYVTQQSKLTKGGQSATLDDVAVGEQVGGLARMGEDGKASIVSMRIGPKPDKNSAIKE